MSPFLKKVVAGGLIAATLSVGLAAASTPAEAFGRGGWGGGWHGGWGGGWHGGGWGWGVGAGVLGGLALGAALASPYYGYGNYGYGYPAYDYGYGGCYWTRRPAYTPYGQFVGYRSVEVCN